jgi:hypothetical protein
MNDLKKLAALVGILSLCACASWHRDRSGDESASRKVDCSTVRCAACPAGQHPALRPPDCCRCIPD